MLQPKTVAVVRQSLPALRARGEALTRHFYDRMCTHYPGAHKCFKPVQQRIPADTIGTYARHIENPVVLSNTVELIIQKHVSLGIKPEHHPIVGKDLLASIQDVLGETATDETAVPEPGPIRSWSTFISSFSVRPKF